MTEAFFVHLSKPFGTVDQTIILLPAATGFLGKGCFLVQINYLFNTK